MFAYIDPASGAIILQMILAGTIGGLLYFRRFIARLASVITGRRVAQVAGTTSRMVAASEEAAVPSNSTTCPPDERHGD
jgi:hypothetical protein